MSVHIALCLLAKQSSVSVVFVFNTSPSDAAPVSSILFPVIYKKRFEQEEEKESFSPQYEDSDTQTFQVESYFSEYS